MVTAAEAKSIAAESLSMHHQTQQEVRSLSARVVSIETRLKMNLNTPLQSSQARGAVSVRKSGVYRDKIENEFNHSSPVQSRVVSIETRLKMNLTTPLQSNQEWCL